MDCPQTPIPHPNCATLEWEVEQQEWRREFEPGKRGREEGVLISLWFSLSKSILFSSKLNLSSPHLASFSLDSTWWGVIILTHELFCLVFPLHFLEKRDPETILDEFLAPNQGQPNPVPKLHAHFWKIWSFIYLKKNMLGVRRVEWSSYSCWVTWQCSSWLGKLKGAYQPFILLYT